MTSEASSEKLQILDHSLTRDQFNIISVAGQAKNVTSRILNCAEVKAKFYDPQGGLIQTLSAVSDNLEPGKIWNFFIMYHREYGEKVDSYKMEVGPCW